MNISTGIICRDQKHIFTLAASVFLQCAANPAHAHNIVPLNNFTGFHPSAGHLNGASVNHTSINPLLPITHTLLSAPRITLTGNVGLPAQGLALDLASSSPNISLGSQLFAHGQSVTINVGGTTQSFKAGDLVTAGEYLAIKEVLKGGAQSLQLSQQGTANGGTFTLNSLSSAKLSELVIPQSVTAYDYFGSNRSFTVSGDILNYGSIYGISNSPSVKGGTIAGSDIIDEKGGLISTQLAGSPLQSTHGTRPFVNLTLSAADAITNYGTITSSGSLNLATAGGSISNVSGAGGSANTPLIKAQDSVNIMLGNGTLTNSGQILSLAGNINLATPAAATNISVNGTGGTLQAAAGNINVRSASYNGSANADMEGGNYLSQNLNLYSGGGAITTNLGEVTGTVNTSGYAAHEFADTSNLTLGSNTLKGDPTFVNTGGNITIDGGVIANEAITILASGSIIGTGDAYISTAHSTGLSALAPAGDVTLVAGATVTTNGSTTSVAPGAPIGTGNTATASFLSGSGGNIDFSKSTHVGSIIATNSNLVGNGNQQQNAGNVTLVAFGTSATNGQVLFPTKQGSITASSTNGSGGNVTILAGQAAASSKPAVSVGTISTATNSLLGTANGSVTIESAQATSTSTATFDSTGKMTSGSFTPSATLGSGSIVINGTIGAGSSAVNASSVTIETAGTGTITETGKGTTISAPEVILSNQTAGLGKSTSSSFSTQTPNLTVDSQGSVFITNIAGVTLNAATFGNSTMKTAEFSLVTVPTGGGGAPITIAGNVTPTTIAGGTSTISLQSSELLGSGGGINDGSKSTLFATNVILSDGPKGTGTANIGSVGRPILTESPNLSVPLNLTATTAGSSFVQNAGSVSLNSSSAGNNGEFSLVTTPDATAGNGQIIVAGTVKSTIGLIGTVNLVSSEQAGVGGIVQSKGGLTGSTVLLADNQYVAGTSKGLGTGDGNLGAAAKPILVTAANLGASTSIGNTAGNIDIADAAKSGVVIVANSKNADNSAFNSYILSSSSGISTASDINTTSAAISNITLKAAGSGYIVVGSTLLAGGAGSTIDLIGSGTGAIGQKTGSLVETDGTGSGGASGSVNLTAGSGGVGNLTINTANLSVIGTGSGNISVTNQDNSDQTLTLQAVTAKAGFSVTTGAGLTILPAITSATSIGFIAGTNVAGTINIDNNIGGSATKSVSFNDLSTGDIVSNVNGKITPLISAIGSVGFTAANGNIEGAAGAPIKVSAPILAANNVSGTAGTDVVDISSTTTKAVTLVNSASDGNFTLNTAGSLTLTNLVSVNGSIDVVSAGSALLTQANSLISVGASGAKAPAGNSLTLENSDVRSGTITIGAGSDIQAYVTGGTDVINVAIGPAPTTPPTSAGLIPTGVVFSPAAGASGPYFFPTQGITVTNPGNVQMNSIGGGQIVFTMPSTSKATAIIVDGSTSSFTPTVFTADPPTPPAPLTGQGALGTPGTNPLSALANSGNASATALPLQATLQSGALAPSLTSALNGESAFTVPAAGLQATGQQLLNPAALGQASLLDSVQATNFSALQALMSQAGAPSSAALSEPTWISETEIAGGMVPAVIVADEDLGVTTPVSSVVEMQIEKAGSQQAGGQQSGAEKLSSLDSAGAIKSVTFTRGAVLFAPSADTEVKTPFGTLEIAGHSLVFAVSGTNGLSIYNLDDRHKNAVVVKTSSESITLIPGQMVTIATSRIKTFDMINPCQMVFYRNVRKESLEGGLQLFTAEFHTPSMVARVMPLKALVSSNHSGAKRIVDHMCKTAAILMQLTANNGNYEQVLSTPLSAMLPK
jgi:hypothetical protein